MKVIGIWGVATATAGGAWALFATQGMFHLQIVAQTLFYLLAGSAAVILGCVAALAVIVVAATSISSFFALRRIDALDRRGATDTHFAAAFHGFPFPDVPKRAILARLREEWRPSRRFYLAHCWDADALHEFARRGDDPIAPLAWRRIRELAADKPLVESREESVRAWARAFAEGAIPEPLGREPR